MSKKIGVIAEDKSDIAVITNIIAKYIPRHEFSVKHFVGNGCGKLKNKCDTWASTLVRSGCDHVIVIHDLDRNDETELRDLLRRKVPVGRFPTSVIIIPVEELEAWLLSDSGAIQAVFSLPKSPKRITDCEAVASPKEYLGKLVWTLGRKRYVNTIHNQKISEIVSLSNLRRCRSYAAFDKYMNLHVVKKKGGGVRPKTKAA